jgi:hypothetical protein
LNRGIFIMYTEREKTAKTNRQATHPMPEIAEGTRNRRGAGRPLTLSGSLAKRIKTGFGIDADELSLRESPEVAEMGAKATAQGNVVSFAPGQFKPDTREGMETLGHELSHVREQAMGGVRANIPGTNIHHDPRHEGASDKAGADFAGGSMGGASPVSLGGMNSSAMPVQGLFDLKRSIARSRLVQHFMGGKADTENNSEFENIFKMKMDMQGGGKIDDNPYGDMTYSNRTDAIVPGLYGKLSGMDEKRIALDKELNTGGYAGPGKKNIEQGLFMVKLLKQSMGNVDGVGSKNSTLGANELPIGSGQSSHSYGLMSKRLGKSGSFWDMVRQKQADNKQKHYSQKADDMNLDLKAKMQQHSSAGKMVSGGVLGAANEIIKSGGDTSISKLLVESAKGRDALGYDLEALSDKKEETGRNRFSLDSLLGQMRGNLHKNDPVKQTRVKEKPVIRYRGDQPKSGNRVKVPKILPAPKPVYDRSVRSQRNRTILPGTPNPLEE